MFASLAAAYIIPIEEQAWTNGARSGSVQQHFINHLARLTRPHRFIKTTRLVRFMSRFLGETNDKTLFVIVNYSY